MDANDLKGKGYGDVLDRTYSDPKPKKKGRPPIHGEPTVAITVRLPVSLLKRIDSAMPSGNRSASIACLLSLGLTPFTEREQTPK